MKIEAYKPRQTSLAFYDADARKPATNAINMRVPALLVPGSKLGGYNLTAGTVTPFTGIRKSGVDTWDYVDNITAAVEAGLVDDETFFEDFFASMEEIQALVERLNDMEHWWVNERHYHAMSALLDNSEEDCTTYEKIGDALLERAVDKAKFKKAKK